MLLNEFRLRASNFCVKNCAFRTFTRRLTSTKCSTNYQHSVGVGIPTFHFQSSLPRLPIPNLKQTCENYLIALRPLVDDKDYVRTEKIVSDFLRNDGAKLQQMLIELDNLNQQTSYISEPTFNRYLSARNPLPINSNPLLVMELDHRPEFNHQLIKTCNIIISTLRLMKSIQTNSFQPTIDYASRSEIRKKFVRSIIRWTPESLATKMAYWLNAIPKDMVQYQRIFGRTRIPATKRDATVQYEHTNHIIVLQRGRIYSVKVLNEIGEIEAPAVIFNRIHQIYQLNLCDTNCSIATLTTLDRDHWAKLRKYLSINLDNEIQLQVIDSALFCVSIENSKSSIGYDVPQLNVLFAGDGKNRWLDKSITMAIDIFGTVGISFEHSWGDGRTMQRITEEIYNDSTASPSISPYNTNAILTTTTMASIPNDFVREIEFNVDASMGSEIEQAQENHTHKMHSLKLNNFRFIKLNRKVCKYFQLSPDSMAQLGFQLAFYKQRGKFVSTYEPCNTQKFFHGRTEAIRPCTTVTQQLCYAICHKTETNSKLFALITTSSRLHSETIRQSANGQGCDRHLYCLRYLAQQNGFDEPDIFRDNSYKALTRNTMIATSISSKALKYTLFGPGTPDGYGIWYVIDDGGINVTMSYYPDYADGLRYLELLDESYTELLMVLESEKLK